MALWASVFLIGRPGRSTSGQIVVESVSDYSYKYGHHLNDIPCNTEGDGFYNTAPNIPGLVQAHNYNLPNAVYDTDFYDADLTHNTYDNDGYFDHVGFAVSFFCGHGSCGDDVTTTLCSSGANCASGQVCPGMPPSAYSSKCVRNSPTSEVFMTSSPQDKHGHFVKYGATTIAQGGGVAWGESTQSGSWKGAGTNEGTNLVVFINSCGLRAPFWNQVANAFAGAHLIAGAMPVTVSSSPSHFGIADVALEGHRGSYFAAYGTFNPAASVSSAWSATLDSLSSDFFDDSCPDFGGSYSSGGGKGFFSCGCHFVLSQDSDYLKSLWHASYETWIDLQDDSHDATGSGGGVWGVFHCNYDNITYPFTK